MARSSPRAFRAVPGSFLMILETVSLKSFEMTGGDTVVAFHGELTVSVTSDAEESLPKECPSNKINFLLFDVITENCADSLPAVHTEL